ncbi:MAG: helix-turn-helix domain-containing protein [Pseudomonadota bacterium]
MCYAGHVNDERHGSASKSATVHSVVVAVHILELLADRGRPQRVTDIATHLGMTKARISRHLSTLAGLGLVAKVPDNSGYRLGSMLFRLANAASEQYEITNIASRYMLALRNRIGEALLLAIPAGGDALVVSTIGSGKPLTPQISRGERYAIPASPTAWVVLAFSPGFVRERVVMHRTDRNAMRDDALDMSTVRAKIDQIRQRYYEFELDPHDAGFSVLSAPIFDHTEKLEAALTIVMNRRQNDDVYDVRHLPQLKKTVVEISSALGSVEMADKMAATL